MTRWCAGAGKIRERGADVKRQIFCVWNWRLRSIHALSVILLQIAKQNQQQLPLCLQSGNPHGSGCSLPKCWVVYSVVPVC